MNLTEFSWRVRREQHLAELNARALQALEMAEAQGATVRVNTTLLDSVALAEQKRHISLGYEPPQDPECLPTWYLRVQGKWATGRNLGTVVEEMAQTCQDQSPAAIERFNLLRQGLESLGLTSL